MVLTKLRVGLSDLYVKSTFIQFMFHLCDTYLQVGLYLLWLQTRCINVNAMMGGLVIVRLYG